MNLTLYSHPLASYCHKVLIALYELGTPFEQRVVDFGDPADAARFFAVWPVGKIPVLHDAAADRIVPETSIIIEYLDRAHGRLLPRDEDQALEARLWDRFFDLYVSTPMQTIVGDRLRPEGERDPHGVAEAHEGLRLAYRMIEERMRDRVWAGGDGFGIADCAAAPALFYSQMLEPFEGGQTALDAYRARLEARPSVARVIAEARPYFQYFPFKERIPSRFLQPAA